MTSEVHYGHMTSTVNGPAVRDFRRARRLSQQALARKVLVSRAHLCRVEKGRRGASQKLIRRLARALGVRRESITRTEGAPHD